MMAQRLPLFLVFLACLWSLCLAASKVRDPFSAGGHIILDKPECGQKRIEKVDKDVNKVLVIGKSGRKFPTNRDELKIFCKDTAKYTQTLDNFVAECFEPDARKIAQIFVFSLKQALKPLCAKKKSKKANKMMEIGACLNTFANKVTCTEDYTNKTLELIPYDIGGDKIKYLCCGYVDGVRCAERYLDQNKCVTNDGRDLILELFRSIGGDIINFGCGDYNESTDRCDSLKLPPKSKLDKSIKIDKSKIKSFFLATVAVTDSMGVDEAQPLS